MKKIKHIILGVGIAALALFLFVGNSFSAPNVNVLVLHTGEGQVKTGDIWVYNLLVDRDICLQGVCADDFLSTARGEYDWVYGEWSECNLSCGDGEQTRSAWCEREDGARFNNELCAGKSLQVIRSCTVRECGDGETPECVQEDLFITEPGGGGRWTHCK